MYFNEQMKLPSHFFYFLVCLLVTFYTRGQTEELMKIIEGVETIELRQKKIDFLLLVNEKTLTKFDFAELCHNIGNKWYFNNWNDEGKQEDLKNAILYTGKAVKAKQALSVIDTASLKKSLYNLGYFHALNEEPFEAINTFSLLVDLGHDDNKTQFARLELGSLYKTTGDFHKAIESLNDIISFYNVNNDNPELMVDANIELADTYGLMGFQENSKLVDTYLLKADSILKVDILDDNVKQAQVNQLQGNRLLKIGNYSEALKYHKMVLNDTTELYREDLAKVYNSIGLSLIKLKDYVSALEYLKKSISYDANLTQPYENLGDLYLIQNQFEKGLFNYQKSISLATGHKDEVKYNILPKTQELEVATDKISLLDHLIAKANAWLKYYQFDDNKTHLEEALKTFTHADGLIDVIRNESTEYQSKLFWREKGASLYMKAVEVCYLLKKPQEAFHFMERNKALLLLEDITSEQAKDIAKIPQAIAKREFELKRAIYLSENEFQNMTSASKDTLELLNAKVYKSKRQYELFTDSLAVAYPEYAKIKKKVDVLPYAKFKEKYISSDEVVLHYILNNEQGYGLLSTKQRPYFFKLENVPDLNEKLVQLYGLLTDQTSDRARRAEYNNLAHKVFTELAPIEVYKNIKGKRLTLINDFILQQIPFEALITDVQNGKYLIEETEIRYAYSISYLDAKKYSGGTPIKELMGFAPVQFASLGLANLNFSDEEVREVENIFNGELLLNGQATKNRFLTDQSDFKILHLSTHADVGEGGNPWIAFSDEKLFLNEIYALKNQSDMVVLSGCNTSMGELKKGEGAMSLARGFFHSGAKSVVSSLWTLNDKKSKELMTEFYSGLAQGMTKSEAMQKAKIKFLSKYRNSLLPSYWASLIVIGNNEPISKTGPTKGKWIFLGSGSVLAALLFYGYQRKRLKKKPPFL